MPDFVVVANDQAGGTGEKEIAEGREELSRSGSVAVVPLRDRDTLDRTLDDLGDRTLVVAGGDGTLHRVVQRLRERNGLGKTTIGLMPLGTGNDFARSVGIPLTPVGAAATIRFGRPAELDLLVDDDDGVVVNAAHTGISSQASEQAATLKPFLRQAAYPVAALLTGAQRDGVTLHVTVDDALLATGTLLFVAVMNGSSVGGGTRVVGSADPTDGVVDVVAVPDPGRVRRVRVLRALRAGRLGELSGVCTTSGREVTIGGSPTRHNVDGEIGDEVVERRYRVLPRAWRMLLPGARPSD